MDTSWPASFREYDDRRTAQGIRGIANAVDYWTGLGVPATAADIEAETVELQRRLRAKTRRAASPQPPSRSLRTRRG